MEGSLGRGAVSALMDRKGIHEFMREIDALKVQDQGEWVMACCPLSPWRREHGNKQEQRPSFGISVHDDNHSVFNCFTCGSQGTLPVLLDMLGKYEGNDYDEYKEQIEQHELLGPPQGQWREKGRVRRQEKITPLDKQYEDLFDPCDPHHFYLEDRHISAEACERLQLKYDADDGHGEARILFPIWNHKGEFFGYSGRAIFDDAQPKVRDYYGLPKRAMLAGIHLHEQADYICLAEGLTDYAVGQSMGFPVVASMHSGLTEAQARILIEIGKPVYGFLDNDAAGRKGNLEAAKRLVAHLPFMAVRWPKEAGDVGELYDYEMQRMIDRAQVYRIRDEVL